MSNKDSTVVETADVNKSLTAGNAPDMLEKILADTKDLADKTPLGGWELVAENIALDEAERERLIAEIPYFREQALHAIAYWMSLSRRVDALTRTKQLLARLPDGKASATATGPTPHD